MFQEMRYPINFPDEKGGGVIEPLKANVKFEDDLGFLSKTDGFTMSRDTKRKISKLQDSLYGISPRDLLKT